jgi:bifunctional non-homologous end joining protein LigD
MLARSGPIPTRGEYSYEVKWDGFRCLLSTENRMRALSRRRWDMTDLLPELASFPVFGTFDGELVALDSEGAHDFPLLCERMLMKGRQIPIVYVIFDILSLDGHSLMGEPYSERREQLEALNLKGISWTTPGTFDDGEALFEAVCEHGLEGIVAKRAGARYRPGYRGSKLKTVSTGAGESAINKRRPKMFV